MSKIRKGDEVILTTGKDKGKRGTVLRILDAGHVVVEGVNKAKKHTRPNPMKGINGGILDKEMPIDISNVALFNSATQKGDRVGFKMLEDGRKVRVFKSNGEVIDA
jgi:large subunit ribosomal protein L24